MNAQIESRPTTPRFSAVDLSEWWRPWPFSKWGVLDCDAGADPRVVTVYLGVYARENAEDYAGRLERQRLAEWDADQAKPHVIPPGCTALALERAEEFRKKVHAMKPQSKPKAKPKRKR